MKISNRAIIIITNKEKNTEIYSFSVRSTLTYHSNKINNNNNNNMEEKGEDEQRGGER